MPRFEGNVHRVGAGLVPIPPHRHAALELNVVLRGRATHVIDGHAYQLRAPALLWLFPAQEHVLVDLTRDHVAWVAHFGRALVLRHSKASELRPLRGQRAPASFHGSLTPPRARNLGQLCEMVAAADDAHQHSAGLSFLMLSAWRELARGGPGVAGLDVDRVPAAVRRALALLHDPQSALSLDDIARACGTSRAVLTRQFRAHTGTTVVAYRNRVRVQRAAELYGEGLGPSLTEAALAAGFGSYAQFHRACRQLCGCSPRQLVGAARGG